MMMLTQNLLLLKPLLSTLLIFTIFSSLPVAESNINDGPVCSLNQTTFASFDELVLANEEVLHCGPCGACSSNDDIDLYVETRNTLTRTTGNCAILSLAGIIAPIEKAIAKQCLKTLVGFSDDCLNCWVNDIACSKRYCQRICLKYLIQKTFNQDYDDEDPCLLCNESNCGPSFVTCVGANRRRSGIQSDIDRPEDEICSLVTRP